jgi:hypothetical protein
MKRGHDFGGALPRSAAQDVHLALGRAAGVHRDGGLIVVLREDVVAPLGDVAVHVVEAPRVRLLRADRMGLLVGVVREPGVFPLAAGVAERVVRRRSRTAGVLPFRLGRQPIAVLREVALRRVLVVAGLEALGLRPHVAEQRGFRPGDHLDGEIRTLEARGVRQLELLVLRLGDFRPVDQEGIDVDLVDRLLDVPAPRASHLEVAFGDQDHLRAAVGLHDRQRGRGNRGLLPRRARGERDERQTQDGLPHFTNIQSGSFQDFPSVVI